MALFESSRLLIPNPLDVVEDKNCGDVPTEEDEARDKRLDQVNDLAAELSHFAQFCLYSTLQRIADEFIDGKITHKEMVEQSKGKKVAIKT